MQTERHWTELYPDQALCFWLGFLPTGIWVAILATGVEVFLNALCGGNSSLVQVFIKTLISYSVPAGIFSLMLGYLLRNVRPHSPNRWVWLSLVIPMCTFMFALFLVELEGMIQTGRFEFHHTADDMLIGMGIYSAAALVFGLTAMIVIAILKFIRKTIAAAALET